MSNRYADVTWVEDGLGSGISSLVRPINALDAAVVALEDGTNGFNQFNLATASELTIADGAITVTGSHHTVDTEDDTSSDTLTTINGGSEGDVLYLRLANAGRVVTLDHETGNIYLTDGVNYSFPDAQRSVELFHNGTYWTDSSEASPGTVLVTLQDWTELESAAANVSVSDIPSDYKTLILRVAARSTYDSAIDQLLVRFNDDATATHYLGSLEFLYDSGTASQTNKKTISGLYAARIPTSTAPSDYMNTCEIVIQNVAASRPKPLQAKGTVVYSATPLFSTSVAGGLWLNTTDLINKITLLTYISTWDTANLDAGTAYALYGEK